MNDGIEDINLEDYSCVIVVCELNVIIIDK